MDREDDDEPGASLEGDGFFREGDVGGGFRIGGVDAFVAGDPGALGAVFAGHACPEHGGDEGGSGVDVGIELGRPG